MAVLLPGFSPHTLNHTISQVQMFEVPEKVPNWCSKTQLQTTRNNKIASVIGASGSFTLFGSDKDLE